MNREKVMTFMKKSLRFLPDKAYTLLLICDALSISITDLADKDVSMTEDEKWIISSYRSLSTKKKEMLTTYIKIKKQKS